MIRLSKLNMSDSEITICNYDSQQARNQEGGHLGYLPAPRNFQNIA